MSFNISKRGKDDERESRTTYTAAQTAPASTPAQTESRGFHITKRQGVELPAQQSAAPEYEQIDRQEQSAAAAEAAHTAYRQHQQALATERADEADKLNVESPYRQAQNRSTWERIGEGIMSGLSRRGANYAADAAVVADNQGGTAMRGVYDRQLEALDSQIAALNATLSDPTMTAQDILETNAAIKAAEEQRKIYAEAVRSSENTARGIYETVDDANRYAQEQAEKSVEGTSGIGRKALSAIPTATNIALDIGGNILVPSMGTLGRGLDEAGQSMTEYRYKAGENYDPRAAAQRGMIAGSGVLAGSLASGATNAGVLKLLKNKGLQNNVIPYVLQNGLSGTAYAGGDIAMRELAKASTDEDYTPDWKQIGTEALTSFAFGVINGFVSAARMSSSNKAYMRELNKAVKDRYDYAKSVIENSGATDAQRAAGATSVMDAVDQMRYALDDMQIVGAAGEVKDIQDFLMSIYGEMLPYTTPSAGGIGGSNALANVAPPTAPANIAPSNPPALAPVPTPAATGATPPAVAAGMAATTPRAPAPDAPVPSPAPAASAQAEPVEAPAGSLTPAETKPTEARETTDTTPLRSEPERGTMETGKAGELQAALGASSRVNKDGIEYTITQIAGSDGEPLYIAELRNARNDAMDGMIRDGFASKYRESFRTREEAASALVNVAKNSGFLKDEQGGLDNGHDGRRIQEGASENPASASGARAQDEGRSGVSGELRGFQPEAGRLLFVRSEEERDRVSRQAAEYGTTATFDDVSTWKNANPAYTDKDGNVHLRSDIGADRLDEAMGHELTHAMKRKGYRPYLDFVERSISSVDLTSDAGNKMLMGVAAHRGIDLSAPLTSEQLITVFDEIAALVRGAEASGHVEDILGELREAFEDYDAFAAELNAIHKQYVAEQNGDTTGPKDGSAWENVVNGDRISQMSSGELGAVKGVFEKSKQTSVATTPEKQAESAPLKPKDGKTGDKANLPQQQIADDVRRSIEKGIAFNSARLFEIADKAYGGTMSQGAYTVKDAYDGMELAVNQYLMASKFVQDANGDAKSAQKTLVKLQDLLAKLPTQTKRSAEMESYQQFSTPPNIAYLAAWTANIDAGDVVLEPSAGIGGLALWPKAWGATVYGNELSERRLAFLNQLGLDGTFNLNAEQINNLLPDEIKPTTVLMNPPFSSTAGRTATNKTANAKRHIEQALDRLEDGGRLVAILGNGMSNDASAFRSWWNDLRQEYSIRANIRIDGENYKKYGTTFDVQLVVIDKDGPQMGKTITGEYKDLSEIPAIMEGIRNDRTRLEAAPRAEQNPTVSGLQEASARPVGSGAVSRAGTERGTGGERAGLGKQERARNVGTEGVAEHAGDVGRGSVEQSGGGVQDVHDQRGTGRGRNERRNPPAKNGSGGEPEREAAVPAQRDTGKRGEQRVQLERSVPAHQLTKEAAEHPDSVYSTYVPRKARVKGAKPHPAKLVESAAMAAVEPPDVTYTPNLPESIVKGGVLSDAQLENVIYAGQAHAQKLPSGARKGFFIGDGTGVGKGRQIAGIIMDNFRQGRDKAVWVSEKAALINDAMRDWTALGGKESDVIDLKKIKYKAGAKIAADSGILFSSYDTLKTDKDARIKLLQDWLGKDFDGVIALDEAHNMGNANGKKGARGATKPSAKALAGIDLQNAFPNARIVYASATGATEASNYAYLQRLGLWGKGTAFNDFNDFMSKISNGGLAAMELVARDMKAMGEYMARSISYDDVKYDTLTHELTPMQTEIYNTMSKAWQKVLQNVNDALEITGQQNDGMARGRAMSQIFGTQQRFYNQILTSMSMPTVIEDMKKELAAGRSCVLQLVNTNAAAADRAIAKNADEGGDLDDLDLTPSDMLIGMVQKSFPIELYEEYTDEDGRTRSRPVLDAEGKPVIDKKAVKLRDALLDDLKMMKVPDGPLEMLFDAFGEENVAEVTGRTRRVVEKLDETGGRKRVIERRTNNSGIADANMFQDGKKRILVFSDAGGTGRSYHADLTAKNQQQRVHYLLQPGWEASKAVQGFGRTHRSNQASAPIFRLITTNVMGQKRFTSTIARRLDQLGALTKGQRQAGSGVFGEKDNLENPIAMDALSQYYKTLSPDTLKKLGLYDKIYDEFGRFNDKSDVLRDIGKFLNRILSLEVDEQNEVFQGFYDTFDRFMDTAIANGTVDMGLENYRADKVDVVDEKTVRKDPTGADTKYVQMTAYRKPVITPYNKVKDAHDKFQGIVRMEDGSARAVYEISSKTNQSTGEIQRRFKLEGPVKGKSSTYLEETLKNQTKPVPKDEWKEVWNEEIEKAPEYDTSTLHLLTGTLLPIWDRLPQDNTRVMRVLSSDGRQYLGRVIRPDQIDSVLRGLGANRTMKQYSEPEVKNAVLTDGKEAVFRDNKMKLNRRRVSGEWRMELTGDNIWYIARQYSGIINERIGYQYRYFIPTSEAGDKILRSIMETNPIVDLHNGASEEVDELTAGGKPEAWTAERIKGGEVKEASSLSEIIGRLRHDFGVNITAGHVRGAGKLGQYNRSNRGIRTKIANDLPTAAHELGHHFDNIYSLRDHLTPQLVHELQNGLSDEMRAAYPPNKWNTEGIAEYFKKYLQNRETAAIDYPTFTAYVKGLLTVHDAALLDQFADEVNAYYSLDADTATSSIRTKEEGTPDARTYSEKIHDKYDVLYQQWTDSNHGIKLFSDATGGADSYKLATNAAYSDAMAGAIITGDLTDANGQYVSPGLGAALHGINLRDKNEYRLFGEYLTVKHGPERLAEGMRIFADDRKNSTAWMQNRQAELEEKYPEFAAASERLYRFIHDLYQAWGVDTGLISQETLDGWRERWQYYVPLNRAVSMEARGRGARRGFANQNSTVKQARGSGLDIIHPVDNVINNLVMLVNAGVRNNVMRSITDAAESLGADASFLEKVPTPMRKAFFNAAGLKSSLASTFNDSDMNAEDKAFAIDTIGNIADLLEQYKKGKAFGDVITVMKNGTEEFWKINDPLLLSSITNMSENQRSGILAAYGAITRFMTSAITGNNVVWGIFSNFPRDLQTLFTYSADKNPLHLLGGIGSAYVNKFKGDHADPLYKEYLAMGGGQTSVYTADRDLAKKARAQLSGSKLQWLNPMEWLAFVSDTIESGPRYATYKICRQKGMTPQESIYAAHDITVNFRRAGATSRDVNKVIPFFNAGVQGLDKFARWVSAQDAPPSERKGASAKRFFGYMAAMAALGAAFYALNNTDEEARENYHQLSNYTKNSYWVIPLGDGKYFAIPKARELSVPASLFETLTEYAVGGNKRAFKDFWDYAAGNFLPSVVSDIVAAPETGLAKAGYSAMSSLGIAGVIGSVLANRDFLGRPIVSASMQYYEPRDQYNRRTSKLAKAIGDALNVSPMKVDYFFQQTLGGYWKAQKALFPVGGENVDLTLGVQNSYIKDNQYSTDLLNWLYDKASASAAAKKSDPASMEKAITATMDERMTTFYSRYYKLAKDNPETTPERGTRQIVLDMIAEYQKATDNGYLTDAERMIYAVCEQEGTTEYLPATMQSTVKDKSKTEYLLSDVQYVEYQTDYLRRYYEYVETTLPTAKTDAESAAILKAAKTVAKDGATDRVLKRIGADTTGTLEQYGDVDDTSVILFKAALDLADDDGGLSQVEVIDAINALGLSRGDSSTLFHTKYDSDKNNPYVGRRK